MSFNIYEDIEKFANREIKAKDIFYIKQVPKTTAYSFIRKYHYLGDAKFFSMYQFGLYHKDTTELVGCATFSLPQGTEATMSWFSLPPNTQNILELSRLCMLPQLNKTNATSFLLGGSIKQLSNMNEEVRRKFKKDNKQFSNDDFVCRAVITLALASRHPGSIYQVCNFKYYGMTNQASDFYASDGSINPRGKVGSFHGVYLPRERKHRYAYIIDKNLKCNYEESVKPLNNNLREKTSCCNGTKRVFDKRFCEWYSCPRCTGHIDRLDSEGNVLEVVELKNNTFSEKVVDTTKKFSFDDLFN